MGEVEKFRQEVVQNVEALHQNKDLMELAVDFIGQAGKYKYSYNFSWMGRPIIQFPQDIIAMQEIIWRLKPDVIVETGIAHGGSLIFYASILELVGHGQVIGIDIDIRSHNRAEVENHPMYKRITMIEGSSIDNKIFEQVHECCRDKNRVLVVLDSNHTHSHVLAELNLYSSLVTKGSYLVVMDTVIEDLPEDSFVDRPWGKGNNPKTAVKKFLEGCDRFVIDETIPAKLLITVAPDGYLKCIK